MGENSHGKVLHFCRFQWQNNVITKQLREGVNTLYKKYKTNPIDRYN